MGDDVELHGRIGDTEALLELPLHVGALGEDELVEPAGILDVVAPPVVIELEAGVVIVAVLDRTGLAEQLIPVAADTERAEDTEVGVELDGQAEQLDLHPVENAVGIDGVAQLAEGGAFAHR